MHIRIEKLRGLPVLDATGASLGRIKAPLVDMETWLVDVLRVTATRHVAGELGLVWSWWNRPTLDIQTSLIQAAGDAIILRVSLGELHDAMPSAVDEPAMASIH